MNWDWVFLININFISFKLVNLYYYFYLLIDVYLTNFFFLLIRSNFNLYLYFFIPFNFTLIYTVKFLLALFFLIFIRAGLPRYRYDYLTKLGWSKFLLIALFILVFNYINFFYWS
jgi:NADH:ubiquinone oxidoreductase subunit H